MNKEIEEKIDQLLDKHIGKVYKDWNEVVKAKDEFRSALSSMFKPQVMDLDKLPKKKEPDIHMPGFDFCNGYNQAIDDCRKSLASKLIGREDKWDSACDEVFSKKDKINNCPDICTNIDCKYYSEICVIGKEGVSK